MRTHARSLGLYVPGRGVADFVPAKFSLPPQPAGIGSLADFVRAQFDIPPQPAGIGAFVRGAYTIPPQPALGDFVPTGSMYPIPINSVLAGAAQMGYEEGLSLSADSLTYSGGVSANLSGIGDCGCGCGGSCGQGMSGISTDLSNLFTDVTAGNWSNAWTDFTTLMGEPVVGTVPLWMVGGGVILVWALFFSGGSHSRYQRGRRASAAAARAYA